MKSKFILLASLILLSVVVLGETQTNDGVVTNVIVYHGRALVTRTIELDNADGDVELLVENLPERILPESIYAQAADGVQVLSVRYRIKEVEKDMREEVQELNRQIEELENQLYRLKRDHQLAMNTANRFAQMWEFSFEGASVSLDRAAFSSETMKDFTSYLEEKGQHWHIQAVDLEQEQKDLEKHLAKLNEEKTRLQIGHRSNIRQALVYLHIPKTNSSSSIQLSYLVDGADWSPQYNLKARAEEKLVNVEYNAVVHQASGEDWTNAQLALSTAVPALVATPPTLEPLEIRLVNERNRPANVSIRGNITSSDLTQQMQMPQQGQRYVTQSDLYNDMVQSRYDNIAKGIKANPDLNWFASNTQMIEFEADKRLLQEIQRQAVAIKRSEGVSVMYSLPGRLTLPSKSDQQLVSIASIECPAAFTFTAAPLLTDYVYLEGELTNASETILLPGVADTFRNGEFVGKGDMKLVTIGQTFTAGFGVDSQIQVSREFKDKDIKTLLGNRVDENQYRIAISNYYDKPVALRLMDRLPWTENNDLDIELAEVSHPLSTDAEYVRTQKAKGILRWDLSLEPNTSGENATVVNYTFMMKYDNDMAIQNVQ